VGASRSVIGSIGGELGEDDLGSRALM